MNLIQVLAVAVVVAQAVVAFLLAQQGFTFEPIVQLILGALSVALTTIALYLKPSLPGSPAGNVASPEK